MKRSNLHGQGSSFEVRFKKYLFYKYDGIILAWDGTSIPVIVVLLFCSMSKVVRTAQECTKSVIIMKLKRSSASRTYTRHFCLISMFTFSLSVNQHHNIAFMKIQPVYLVIRFTRYLVKDGRCVQIPKKL